MYRPIVAVFLCLSTAAAAPRSKDNNDVINTKTQPFGQEQTETLSTRESKIDNLPLTTEKSSTDRNQFENIASDMNRSEATPTDINQFENIASDMNRSEATPTDINQFEHSSRTNVHVNDNKNSLTHNLTDAYESNRDNRHFKRDSEQFSNPSISNLSQAYDTKQNESETNRGEEPTTLNSVSNEVTDTTDIVTERYDLSKEYQSNKENKTSSPELLSKLSYFQKNNDFAGGHTANLFDRIGKRRFKSKCRCEKIWNCPKLQITVPRCPEEYFLCCF